MPADAESAVAALAALIAELPGELRRQALTHSSWTEDRVDSFERLAFLGDSVLGLSVASDLFARFPDVDSGGLTKSTTRRSAASPAPRSAACSASRRCCGRRSPDVELAIPAEVLLGGERPLPEATEALIGACFLAFGFERTAAAVAGGVRAADRARAPRPGSTSSRPCRSCSRGAGRA